MIQETGIIEEWLAESEARGEEKGEMQGRIREARSMLLRLGTKRFGEADEQVKATVEAITSLEILEDLAERLLVAETWQELLSPVEEIGLG